MDAHPSDVLVIEHEADCPPGVLADVLAEVGLTLHLHRPHRGDQLPMDLGTFEGLVVLGGGMGARDDAEHPWLPQTRRLLAAAGRLSPSGEGAITLLSTGQRQALVQAAQRWLNLPAMAQQRDAVAI